MPICNEIFLLLHSSTRLTRLLSFVLQHWQPNGFLSIKMPELAYSRSYQRTYLRGVLAKIVVDIAKALGKPLAVEKLDSGKEQLGTDKRLNRMAANFPYRKMIEAVIRKACKEDAGVEQIWPAHTSTTGPWKHTEHPGITVHQAAAQLNRPAGERLQRTCHR